MEMSSEKNNNNVGNRKVPFETALDEVGFGLYSWLLTALSGVTIIGYACIVYSGTIVSQTSACELDTTVSQQRFLVSVPVIAIIIGAIVWGYLADTYGRRSMALASFCSATVVNCIASFSVHWVMLLVFQFVASFLASGQYSIMMSLLSECIPQARRNLVVLVVASIFMLAQGIMALMALPITHAPTDLPALNIQWSPWRSTLIIYCIPSILSFIWISFMEESPKFVFMKKGEEEALKILQRIHRINHYRSKEELQIKGLLPENSNADGSTKPENKNIKELFKGTLLKYLIIMTTLTAFLQTSAFMLWLPKVADQFVETLRREDGGAGQNLCSLIAASQESRAGEPETCTLNSTSLLFVFGVGALQSLFNTILLIVVGKFGRRNMVMVIAPVCGISGIIVNLIPNAIASAVFFVIFLLSIVNIGLYTAITLALFPTHLRALAVSLTMTGGRVVLFIVALVLNSLFTTNCNLAFYIFASVVAASAIIAFFLPDERYVSQSKAAVNTEAADVKT